MSQNLLQFNMELISGFASWIYPYILLSVFIALFFFLKKLYKKSFLALLTLGGYLYSVFLKALFKFPRPSGGPSLKRTRFYADIYGFPSSHTVVYTVFWGFIIYLTFSLKFFENRKTLKIIIQAISAYFLAFVGTSRIYLGFHSVRDILGGYLFGGLFLGFLILLDSLKLPSNQTE